MDRRTFGKLAGLALIGATSSGTEMHAQTDAAGKPSLTPGPEVVLEDDQMLIAFDQATGAITRMVRKKTGWAIQRKPEFGISFRMLAPLPHQRANFILGSKQRATKVQKVSANEVHLEWSDLDSEHGGSLKITLRASVKLEHGRLRFEAEVENDSGLPIETIDYPYFGDLASPAPEMPMRTAHYWYANLPNDDLYPRFPNQKGYWGVDYPTQAIDSKQSMFCLVQSPAQGLYVEAADPTLPYLAEFTFELHPGWTDSVSNTAPIASEISGHPVHIEFRVCHFVFVAPHARKQMLPVHMEAYDGTWHSGIDVYKARRARWFKQPYLPAWVQDVHSWLQLQVDGAEQDFAIKYRELPRYIDDCVKNGVEAIQLVGWNIGGQDGGDPSQDTDPGLGTWEELHQAVQYANKRGVKMIMFAKIWWADLTTEYVQKQLYKYAATDPFGIPYQVGGYSYDTPTQLAGINNRRRDIMCVQSQAFRDISTREFKKILAFGASGFLFDEVCHHGPVEFCFNKNHGHPVPAYIYGGDLPLAKQYRDAADAVDRDFIFSGEGPQDWLLQYYPVSYFRINNGTIPVARYIDSQAPLVVAVTGFDDREMLNLIFMHRYVISYEPYNFKGYVSDFPLTAAYGQKIDALRRRYKAMLWESEFLDVLGATVTGEGIFRYAVYRAKNGRRAVIVINQEKKNAISVTVALPQGGSMVMASPEQQEAQPVSGAVTIPARSAVVVMEA